MAIRNKLIGILLILLGAWPFLLKIDGIKTFFESYTFLAWLTPGEILYQLVIIILGVLLLLKFRPKIQAIPR